MKVIIVLLMCCLAVTLANESEDVIDKYLDECKKELKYTEADASDLKKDSCFRVCMYKKEGKMKADGTFDLDKVISSHPKEIQEKVRKAVVEKNEECTKKANGDACALAACFSRQVYQFD